MLMGRRLTGGKKKKAGGGGGAAETKLFTTGGALTLQWRKQQVKTLMDGENGDW